MNQLQSPTATQMNVSDVIMINRCQHRQGPTVWLYDWFHFYKAGSRHTFIYAVRSQDGGHSWEWGTIKGPKKGASGVQISFDWLISELNNRSLVSKKFILLCTYKWVPFPQNRLHFNKIFLIKKQCTYSRHFLLYLFNVFRLKYSLIKHILYFWRLQVQM